MLLNVVPPVPLASYSNENYVTKPIRIVTRTTDENRSIDYSDDRRDENRHASDRRATQRCVLRGPTRSCSIAVAQAKYVQRKGRTVEERSEA